MTTVLFADENILDFDHMGFNNNFFFYITELSKWLEPLEKLRFEISSIPTLINYIKQVKVSFKYLSTNLVKEDVIFSLI